MISEVIWTTAPLFMATPFLLISIRVFTRAKHAISCFPCKLDLCNRAEALQRKLKGTKDVALEKVVAALRDPLTLDNVRAEWVAQQLLESGEKGILLPVNVVLDAYIRGKSRQAPLPARLLLFMCAQVSH